MNQKKNPVTNDTRAINLRCVCVCVALAKAAERGPMRTRKKNRNQRNKNPPKKEKKEKEINKWERKNRSWEDAEFFGYAGAITTILYGGPHWVVWGSTVATFP